MKTVVLVFGDFNHPMNLKGASRLGVAYAFLYSKTIYKRHGLSGDYLSGTRERFKNAKADGYIYNSIFLKDICQLEKFLEKKDDVIIFKPRTQVLLDEVLMLSFKKNIKIIYEEETSKV